MIDRFKLSNSLPSLTEKLIFSRCTCLIDGPVYYMDQFKLLEKFSFRVAADSDFQILQARLSNKWNASVKEDCCNLWNTVILDRKI